MTIRQHRTWEVVIIAALLLATAVTAQTPEENLTRKTLPRFSYPTWSPDANRILYESNTSGNWEIYVMDVDGLQDNGGNITRLTDNPATDRMPSWSPDGEYVAFISDRDGEFEVFRMRPDGSEQTQLTDNEVAEIHPYWSPDGKRIIFNRRVAGERLYAIHTMKRDGSDDRVILRDDDLNSYAQISPDGQYVVFDKWYENNEENGEIYVMNIDGTNLRRLTVSPDDYDGYPTWLPDSRTVLWSSEVNEEFKLFTIEIDGTNRRQLTFGEGNDQRANVAPDGRRIVFNRTIDNNVNIYVLDMEAQ